MGLATQFVAGLLDEIRRIVAEAMPRRMVVQALSGQQVLLRELGQATALGEPYERIGPWAYAANQEVICLPLGGKPAVVGPLRSGGPFALDADVALWSGADMIGYSDAGTTETLRLDPATGVVQGQALRAGGSSGRRILAGSGEPEGSVAGDPGDLYLRSGGSPYAPLYVKAGSGNYGWRPADGWLPDAWECGAAANPGAATLAAIGMGAWTLAGTASNADGSDGRWVNLATAATSGAVASASGPAVARADWAASDRPIRASFVVKLASTVNLRFWLGLFSGDPSGSNTPALSFVGFRYVAGAETDFRCYAGDGTNRSQVGSGVAVDTAAHALQIALYPNIARYYIDGAFVGELSTNLPAATAMLAPWVSVTTLEAVTKSVRFGMCRIRTRTR